MGEETVTKLSVIIPAYKAEKTLKRAVNSILGQTLKDLELIIVNDGSPDSTLSIANDFAELDNRVKVMNKTKNEGLSAARNSGIMLAKGEYITFVDADDWIEPNMYEIMLDTGDGADIIVTGAYHDAMSSSDKVAVATKDAIGKTEVLTQQSSIIRAAARLDECRLFAYSWNKLYRLAFLEEQKATFKNQIRIEDYVFNCFIWAKLKKLALIDGCYYHYVKFSKEALTQSYLPDYFEIMKLRYTLMKNLFVDNNMFDGDVRAAICNMHIKHIISGMIKNHTSVANLGFSKRIEIIKQVLNDPESLEAAKFAKAERRQEKLCNLVFKTHSAFINECFSAILFLMQKGNAFDKLK